MTDFSSPEEEAWLEREYFERVGCTEDCPEDCMADHEGER